jgi:hypothetical protein
MEMYEGESLEDAIARARAEAESPRTEWWDSETHGNFIGGRVVEVFTVDGQHGEFVAVSLETKDHGTLAVAGMRKALGEKIKEKDPKPGDVLTVEYLGERRSEATGFTYHAYAVGHIAKPAEEII